MKRDLSKSLLEWKIGRKHKPLIIRGARQVGKTWLIHDFGLSNFENLVEINFEQQPEMKSCFQTLVPSDIIQKIELSLNTVINPGKTLLFLDEIQECPQALKSLRYFYEKMPELHVAAAGSLLEFVMDTSTISFPVGRILNYYLSPLSFGEFLSACEEQKLREYLSTLSLQDTIPEAIHEKCMRLLKTYLYTGGLPEPVADWVESGNLHSTDQSHQTLLQNYRHDFGKYEKRVNTEILEKVFRASPGMVGSKFKYTSVDPDRNSRDIRHALELLIKAHILHKVTAASGSGLPIGAHIHEKKFKIIFLDTGLVQSALGISNETYLSGNLLAVYKGLVAEQYIGQQLLPLLKPYEEPLLYYWQREARYSNAEVDYLWQYGETIFPIEVKAGKTGTLKSLRIFLDEKKAPFGIRFSLHPLSFADSVLSIPLYAVEALPHLAAQGLLQISRG